MDFKCKTYACDEIITTDNVKELYDDKMEIHYNYINTKSPDDKDRDFLFATKRFYLKKIISGTPKNRCFRVDVEYYF